MRKGTCLAPTCLVTKQFPSQSPGPREEATLAAVKDPAVLIQSDIRTKTCSTHSGHSSLTGSQSLFSRNKTETRTNPHLPHSIQSSISLSYSLQVTASHIPYSARSAPVSGPSTPVLLSCATRAAAETCLSLRRA